MQILRNWRAWLVKPTPAPIEQELFPAILRRLEPFNDLGSDERTQWHYRIGRDIAARDVPGDLVECGVYKGASAATLGLATQGTGRRLWLYDSFEGMPATAEIDGQEASKFIGHCRGTEAEVRACLAVAGYSSEDYIIRSGWFSETFREPMPAQVAMLHIDADWYESVSACLEAFYDRVADGGVIVIDDFGHWEGCREAFYDFAERRRLRPLLERFGHTAAFWVKGRMHNRDRYNEILSR